MNGDGQKEERQICPPLSAAFKTSSTEPGGFTLSQTILSARRLFGVFKWALNKVKAAAVCI